MSKEILAEIKLLKKTLQAIKNTDIKSLDFNSEAALIRHFEVVGGIAKELDRFGIAEIKKDLVWKKSIKMRDKISHSYFSLTVEPIVNAISDVDHLISSLPKIIKEIKNKL